MPSVIFWSSEAAVRAAAKIKVEEVGVVDLSLFSVRPETGECLLPLCTYLEMRSEANVSAIVDGTEKGLENMVRLSELRAKEGQGPDDASPAT